MIIGYKKLIYNADKAPKSSYKHTIWDGDIAPKLEAHCPHAGGISENCVVEYML